MATKTKRPVAWIVSQQGQSKYTEILRSKRDAMEAAKDMRWWPGRITVTPLYAGKSEIIK